MCATHDFLSAHGASSSYSVVLSGPTAGRLSGLQRELTGENGGVCPKV